MEKKPSLILDNEFIRYCELNDIEDVEKLAKETFQRGFTLLKYGEFPLKPQMVANEIIPVKPLSEPSREVLTKMVQIEPVTDTKPPTKDDVPPTPKKPVTPPENNLYDE